MNRSSFGTKKYTILNKIMRIKRCILGIPARLDSSRLPNKILADINGKPMLQRVLKRCSMVNNNYGIVVCTENKKVKDFVESWGYRCFLTSKNCKSGSERLASIIDKLLNYAAKHPSAHAEAQRNPKNMSSL